MLVNCDATFHPLNHQQILCPVEFTARPLPQLQGSEIDSSSGTKFDFNLKTNILFTKIFT